MDEDSKDQLISEFISNVDSVKASSNDVKTNFIIEYVNKIYGNIIKTLTHNMHDAICIEFTNNILLTTNSTNKSITIEFNDGSIQKPLQISVNNTDAKLDNKTKVKKIAYCIYCIYKLNLNCDYLDFAYNFRCMYDSTFDNDIATYTHFVKAFSKLNVTYEDIDAEDMPVFNYIFANYKNNLDDDNIIGMESFTKKIIDDIRANIDNIKAGKIVTVANPFNIQRYISHLHRYPYMSEYHKLKYIEEVIFDEFQLRIDILNFDATNLAICIYPNEKYEYESRLDIEIHQVSKYYEEMELNATFQRCGRSIKVGNQKPTCNHKFCKANAVNFLHLYAKAEICKVINLAIEMCNSINPKIQYPLVMGSVMCIFNDDEYARHNICTYNIYNFINIAKELNDDNVKLSVSELAESIDPVYGTELYCEAIKDIYTMWPPIQGIPAIAHQFARKLPDY